MSSPTSLSSPRTEHDSPLTVFVLGTVHVFPVLSSYEKKINDRGIEAIFFESIQGTISLSHVFHNPFLALAFFLWRSFLRAWARLGGSDRESMHHIAVSTQRPFYTSIDISVDALFSRSPPVFLSYGIFACMFFLYFILWNTTVFPAFFASFLFTLSATLLAAALATLEYRNSHMVERVVTIARAKKYRRVLVCVGYAHLFTLSLGPYHQRGIIALFQDAGASVHVL